MRRNIDFIVSDGEILRSTLYGEQNLGRGAFIVFVHGFKGFKDWGFWPYAGEYLASQGHTSLAFNFSHNGVGEKLFDIDQPDRFARNTFSREIRELSEIVQAVRSGHFGDHRGLPIALVGHSRGGGIALTVASLRREVSAVVTWSSISFFDRYTERQKAKWREDGYFEALNQRTGQLMRLHTDLLDDVDLNKHDLLDLEKSVGRLEVPYLIIHGDQDMTVPVREAINLHSWSDSRATHLRIVPRTGHTFGITHPFTSSTACFDSVLDRTQTFLGSLA
jgi:pimeloyl-ACP methyl ester carboxylesterase